jgi:hypothetical protein
VTPARHEFANLGALTLRLYRANLWPLTAVAIIATVATVAASLALSGSPLDSVNDSNFGLTVAHDADGSRLGFDLSLLLYSLIGLLAGAWATATMVPQLLRFVRRPEPARLDLKAGVPYLGSVALAALLVALLGSALLVILGFTWPGALTSFLFQFAVSLLIGTAALFYVPLIVDGQHALDSLLASLRLVRANGFWRLLAYLLVFQLVVSFAANVAGLLGALLPDAAQPIAVLLVIGVIVTPLMTSFTTVLYLLCVGERVSLVAATDPSLDQRSWGSIA